MHTASLIPHFISYDMCQNQLQYFGRKNKDDDDEKMGKKQQTNKRQFFHQRNPERDICAVCCMFIKRKIIISKAHKTIESLSRSLSLSLALCDY